MLAQTLADVRKRIAKRNKLNENDTKATLIEPVLSALGWDVHDVEEVKREHKAPRGKPVDYALLVMREAKLYLEAKALGENLDDTRFAEQIMTYAVLAGVEWTVLTNGDEWRIYNSHATVPIAEKLLRSVRISDMTGGAEEILGLLSKDQLKTKQIDALWRAQFVDRKVCAALERFFDPDKDMALVNHVHAVTKDLTPDEIRGSMWRCKLTLDFPLSPGDLTQERKPKLKKSASSRKAVSSTSGITIAELVNAGIVKPPLKLFYRYKGQNLEAHIAKDGSIECLGKKFASPSTAGSAALASVGAFQKSGEVRAVNGWDFWKYALPGGKSATIDHLRQAYAAQRGTAATG